MTLSKASAPATADTVIRGRTIEHTGKRLDAPHSIPQSPLQSTAIDPREFARAVCGARIVPGPELLDPEIEALAVDAFRRLGEYLDELTAQYERALA